MRKSAMRTFEHAAAFGLSLALAAALCFGGLPGSGSLHDAWADEADEAQRAVDDAQQKLDGAEADAAAVASDYAKLEQEVADLQTRIDQTLSQAMEAQQALLDGRASLGRAAAYEYRSDSAASLLALLLESQSFDDLVRNLTYLDAIMRYQADEIAAQKERSAQFDDLVRSLNFQKDEQEKKLAELEQKKGEAERAASEASAQLQGAQQDQSTVLAELQRKAEELAAQGNTTDPVAVDDASTVDRGDAVPDGTPVVPDPEPVVPPDSGGSDVGWSTGTASAYGGSTDPYTPNPGTTATGAVCDDWSMGVAVPMAWPRYWQYYGRTVEISYGGQTVFAVVNDCGGMGGGSRVLDLQPGVWKAFGFSSCTDWGLRTVSYRFL